VNNSNAINILLCYFNEVLNTEANLIAFSFLYVVVIGPIPSLLAHSVDWWIWSLCTLMAVIGFVQSILKVLYVANFDALFSGDPVRLGRAAFMISVVATFVPNITIALMGNRVSLTTATLQKTEQNDIKTDFLAWHLVCWTVACIVLFVLTYVGIPMYFTIRGNLGADHYNYFPRVSPKRYLFILFGFAILINVYTLANNPDHEGHVPFFNFIFLFTTNAMLVFQLTDKNVWRYTCRKIFNAMDSAVVHPGSNNIPMNIWSTNSSIRAGTGEADSTRRAHSQMSVQMPVDHLSLAVDRLRREGALYHPPELPHDFCRIRKS
jgi:hypothetical protein